MKKYLKPIILVLIVAVVYFARNSFADKVQYSESVADIPAFSDTPYIVINDNEPEFSDEMMVTKAYESYAELDALGRCGAAVACIGTELMPTEERGSIGQVKPSGWQTVKYDFVDGKYLYNRCHLIGFQLTGENANVRNLITGTRYMNVEGMLPFENMIADYVKETNHHVIYRVTPVFDGDDLVARGVQLEAKSVEDDGDGICFHVYVYNSQPGVDIDYATGSSKLIRETTYTDTSVSYVLNTKTKKFHLDSCKQTDSIQPTNKEHYTGDRNALIDKGYSPGQCCDP